MTTRWLCQERPDKTTPPPTAWDTEEEAEAQRMRLYRAGTQAVIYQADIEETDT